MAARSTIEIIIEGVTRGLAGATAEAERAVARVEAAENNLNRARTNQEGALSRVSDAENRLARSRVAQENAAGRLRVAELQLRDLRERGITDETRIAAAEERLAAARRRVEQAARDTERAEAGVEQARRRARQAAEDVAHAEDELNRIRREGQAIHFDIGLDTFKPALIAGAVAALGALVGQALAAAPALLQLGAVAGTVVLGMDGIKKAATVAAPALDRLKKSVSDTFQQEMTPAFREIAKVLPLLEDGFGTIAFSISQVFSNLVSQVARGTAGLRDLQKILLGAANLVLGLQDGLTKLFGDLLHASAALTSQMFDFGQTVGGVLADIGDAFRTLADTGKLQAAFTGLLNTITGVGVVVKELILALVDAGAAVGDQFGTALLDLGKIIHDLSPAFSALAQVTAGVLVGALNSFADTAKGIGPPLKDLLDKVIPLAPQIGKLAAALLLIKVGSSAVTGIRNLVTALGGLKGLGLIALAAGIAAVAKAVDDANVAAAGGDTGKLDSFSKDLHDFVAAGQLIAQGDFGTIIGQITDQVNQLSDTWSKGQAPIQQWFQAAKDGVTGFLGLLAGIPGQIGGFFSSVGSTVGNAISGAFTSVKSFVQTDIIDVFAAIPGQIVGFFSSIGTTIAGFFSSIGATIAAKASEIWNGFLAAAQSAFEPVRAFFALTPFQMGQAVGAGIVAVINAGVQIITALQTGITTGYQAVLAFFTAIPGQIGAILAALGATLAQVATDAWNAFLAACQAVFASVMAFFTGVPGQVHDAIAPLPGQAVQVATDTGTGFLNTITTWFNNAVSFVATIPGRVGSAIASIVGICINAATQAAQGFLNAVTSGFNAAVSFVASIPGRILSAIGNLGGLLVGAGRSLMDGLLSGIRAGLNAVLDFARGVASQIAAVKGPLPKDRKELIPQGAALMEGLLAGMRQGQGPVLAFASSLAGSVSQAAGAGSGTGGPAGQPITVNVNLSQEQIAGIAQVEIVRANRSTKRTVLAGSGVTF